MCVQAGSIISSNVRYTPNLKYTISNLLQIYRENDKPYYRRGNSAILGIIAWNAVFSLAIKAYYMWRNRTKEHKWNNMNQEEKRDYVDTTEEKGSKRLDFRFAH